MILQHKEVLNQGAGSDMKHLLSMKDLDTDKIASLLEEAERISNGQVPELSEKFTAAYLFYEPSTRTKMSFEMAAHRLGVSLLNFVPEHSSTTKGESLYDTVKTLEAIGTDLVVIRHSEDQYYKDLADRISIPLINAGDGKGEHPTQSLLDLLTIHQEFGKFNKLNIVICGDILHSRVARSNAYALSMLGANVYLSAPDIWQDQSLPYEYISMDEAVEISDVLMLLRVQHERHGSQMNWTIEEYHQLYGLTMEREQRMKHHSIIMHPAPVNRGVEIADELVECDRSRIFKQISNGVLMRMAILYRLLEKGAI